MGLDEKDFNLYCLLGEELNKAVLKGLNELSSQRKVTSAKEGAEHLGMILGKVLIEKGFIGNEWVLTVIARAVKEIEVHSSSQNTSE